MNNKYYKIIFFLFLLGRGFSEHKKTKLEMKFVVKGLHDVQMACLSVVLREGMSFVDCKHCLL